MSNRKRRARREFTDEFKAEAVKLVHSSGKSVGQIAKDLDLNETAIRRWIREAGGQSSSSLAPDERSELGRLRDENRVLRMERDFLKKAAAFFAKESK